jgi:transposase-like protein
MTNPLHPSNPKSSKKAAESEMQEQMMKLRETTLELQQENLALRDEIKKLREQKEPETKLEFSENVCWLLIDHERTGPFCPRCYSEHHRLATLLDGQRFVAKTRWICPVCNHVFDSEV